ncbi:hypothetical protein LOZ61_003108 [Ophidiomyces ophidiicola]|uniref:Uncharacterized protein n=1 Tax=Ophidiomyces ophidiicola TaxID=1387563 RepID=A0ACB8UP30_9EURO|nr:uncharacterized protein LOZ57_005211 [Ophidiomyces ophidiicola]KAI1912904.1 hypothetical protein LOZ61_003108 [Ophidiomyces ophidiicola]KAI1917551.1 hypothetical protein LOZ64_003031 [Ophidiomyces ophidiicola]KAI1930775.1 hypothetical protein LOZ60_000751 [Ophidiomyces ophidiicola]KAI1942914.1 hypothetical protein LOZ57_005211 [Ophidiomyces ophidiicola]KAI1962214.1 hypothetical protein LOZ59_002044 [Ophidiomyces ophidiicola]
MAATSFKADALLLNTPQNACNNQGQTLSVTDAFELDVGSNIETLSDKHVRNRDAIVGLMYVPQLPPNHSCINATSDFIPSNVTRLNNLPARNCLLIALAPWVSAPCTKLFLSQAGRDDATAVILFPPDGSFSPPSPANDPKWDMEDPEWKSKYKLPVYAMPGAFGDELMLQLSQYSGRLIDAPNGDRLEKMYDANSTARVYGVVSLESRREALPGLWVFLLVVLAALVGIVAVSSIGMKFIQHRRRASLRARIAAGDVDLEMLGIKRLRVPQHILDKMPLYTYDKDGHPAAPAPINLPTDSKGEEPSSSASSNSPTIPAASQTSPSNPSTYERFKSSFSQTVCPICLDDYVSGESVVRELPCQHIFHPECIDSFLLQNSSLCPVCKKTVFPPGYCPEVITDAMVRQERYARSRRQRGNQDIMLNDIEPHHPAGSRWRRGIQNTFIGRLPFFRSSEPQPDRDFTAERAISPEAASSSSIRRREEMRRRAVAMLGPQRMVEDEERERDASRPKCEKTPSFRFDI